MHFLKLRDGGGNVFVNMSLITEMQRFDDRTSLFTGHFVYGPDGIKYNQVSVRETPEQIMQMLEADKSTADG